MHMTLTFRVREVVVRIVPVLWLTACAESPVLMTEQYLTKAGEEERYLGGACLSTEKGSGMGGGTAPGAFGTAGAATAALGYQYNYESQDSGVQFVFSDNEGEILAERDYDEAFIDSGRSDEVVVEIGDETHRFVHRGAPTCQAIREPDAG